MADVFVSYANEDRKYTRSMVAALEKQKPGWTVFWDQKINPNESYLERLQKELVSAKSIVVLWSNHSIKSRWVLEEAEYAANRNLLFPAKIETVNIPIGFRTIQTVDLTAKGVHRKAALSSFIDNIARVLGRNRPTGSLPQPIAERPLTEDHLALIHTAWRSPKHDAKFGGTPMYQIRVGLFGHPEALDRVEFIRYLLDPSYPDPIREIDDRDSFFQLKELANGYSMIRAEVFIKDQPGSLQLSRFINLSETGERLENIANYDFDV